MDEKRILLVEDEDNIALALEHLLRRQGFGTCRAATGRDALRQLTDFRPDLVLLDVMLPDISGFELCQTVQEQAERPRIIMMTARGGEVERRKSLAMGADGFMHKPFVTGDLIAEIDQVLAGPVHA